MMTNDNANELHTNDSAPIAAPKPPPVRPDEETLALYRKMNNLVGRNADNLAIDFEKCYTEIGFEEMGAHGMNNEQKQAFCNIMFGSFVNGMITAVSPDSAFNQKFVPPVELSKEAVAMAEANLAAGVSTPATEEVYDAAAKET